VSDASMNTNELIMYLHLQYSVRTHYANSGYNRYCFIRNNQLYWLWLL
jgi:hypothetical protein